MPGIDERALAEDVAALVQVPSVTGDERAAVERLAEIAAARGLGAQVVEHDLGALRAHPGHPGEEAPRSELVSLEVETAGDGPRICLNGHVDVVSPGDAPWLRDPFSGAIEDGHVHGRGAADMKGAVVAALHAVAAVRDAGVNVVLQAVPSEEDGGLGTFAALERDARFDAALLPEPTAFAIATAQAGALTFNGIVPGVSAHAAVRLEGISAIDRYVVVHAALRAHERVVNSGVEHPLMRELRLPYPLEVGRVRGGHWSSQVPDRLEFEGRVGVRVDETPDEARDALEAAVAAACPEATIAWTGGQFAPGVTAEDHPWPQAVRRAAAEELGGEPRFAGVPYGSDMRHFTSRGIPTVMLGTTGLEVAHAVDERVRIDELATLARVIARVLLRTHERPA